MITALSRVAEEAAPRFVRHGNCKVTGLRTVAEDIQDASRSSIAGRETGSLPVLPPEVPSALPRR